MPLRPCSFPGCPKPAINELGRCSDHYRTRFSERGAQKFYNNRHKVLRLEAFRRDGWKCVKCGWKPEILVEADSMPELGPPPEKAILSQLTIDYKRGRRILEADHIVSIPENEKLAADLDNYQTLCSDCHDSKTGSTRKRNHS